MKVMHVIWRPEFGGIERLVLDLTSVQVAVQKLEVSILFGNSVGNFLPAFEQTGARLHTAELSSGSDINPWKLARTRRILRQADLIHVHTFVVPLACAIFLCRRPVVFTEHGNFGVGRKPAATDIIKQKLHQAFVRSSVRHFTFNSEHTGRMWAQRGGLEGIPQTVVPNGVDFASSCPAEVDPAPDIAHWAKGSFVVGTSSRFATVKRIDRLIDAFASFQTTRNVKLLLVGDGPLRATFEQKVADLQISHRTLFTGFRADARACQAAMDVCVFPSTAESFGLVGVETLALGKPTIVFHDGGGLVDIVRPQCPDDVVNDIPGLVRRLQFYHDYPKSGVESRKKRRLHALHYDIQNTAAKFQRVYESILPPSS